MGWRLPTAEELASLVDKNNTNPSLPTGHPFLNVQSSSYWSSSSYASNTSYAWHVCLSGYVGVTTIGKDYATYVWCVRGGQ